MRETVMAEDFDSCPRDGNTEDDVAVYSCENHGEFCEECALDTGWYRGKCPECDEWCDQVGRIHNDGDPKSSGTEDGEYHSCNKCGDEEEDNPIYECDEHGEFCGNVCALKTGYYRGKCPECETWVDQVGKIHKPEEEEEKSEDEPSE